MQYHSWTYKIQLPKAPISYYQNLSLQALFLSSYTSQAFISLLTYTHMECHNSDQAD